MNISRRETLLGTTVAALATIGAMFGKVRTGFADPIPDGGVTSRLTPAQREKVYAAAEKLRLYESCGCLRGRCFCISYRTVRNSIMVLDADNRKYGVVQILTIKEWGEEQPDNPFNEGESKVWNRSCTVKIEYTNFANENELPSHILDRCREHFGKNFDLNRG